MTPNPNPSPACPACDGTKVVSQGGHDTGCNACYVSPQSPPAPLLSTDVESAATGFHEQDVLLKVTLPAPGEVELREAFMATMQPLFMLETANKLADKFMAKIQSGAAS